MLAAKTIQMLAASKPHFNMQEPGQDELAALFSQSMQLESVSLPEPVHATEDDKVFYISAHYNHSYFAPTPPPRRHQLQFQEMQIQQQHQHHQQHHQQQQQQQQQQQNPPAEQRQPETDQTKQTHQQQAPQVGAPDAQMAIINSSPRPASEPPQITHPSVEAVLRHHGVDPSTLSGAQLDLFKTATKPQQCRLVELWRLSPPTNSNDNPTLAWRSTTLEQEEVLAELRTRQEGRRRQQQHQQEIQMQMEMQMQHDDPETAMSVDGTPPTPVQEADGRWTVSLASSSQGDAGMEPYMAMGYEDWARREFEDSARRALLEQAEQAQQQEAACATALLGSASACHRPATDPAYRAMGMGGGASAGPGLNNTAGIHYQRRMEDENARVMTGYHRGEDTEML